MFIGSKRVKSKWLIAFVLLFFILAAFPGVSLAKTIPDIVVHYVKAIPQEGKAQYDVSVYVSVLDEEGKPIKDIELDEFRVVQDNTSVSLISSDLVSFDDPIYIALVLDTSGSMVGDNMNRAKEAAAEFIDDMERDDQVAIITFDTQVRTRIDFTDNHDDAQNELANVQAVPNSGTCLYDAVYDAIQMFATLDPSRRAIVLLTDGVDETTSGGVCSIHTLDDVINLATTGSTRVPIHSIALGDRSDENNLQRMSSLTGGRYRYAPSRDDLSGRFDDLSKQIHAEYVLKFISTASEGDHTILVEVNYDDSRDQDTRGFTLPALPAYIVINSPQSGAQVSGVTSIDVSIGGSTQGKQVKEVLFEINGGEIGRDNQEPYSLSYDFSQLTEGDVTLKVTVLATDDSEIVSTSIPISVVAGGQTAEATEEKESEATPTSFLRPTATSQSLLNLDKLTGGNNTMLLIGGGVILLLGALVVVIIIVVVVMKKKSSDKGGPPPVEEPSAPPTFESDKTMDGFSFGAPPPARAAAPGGFGGMLGMIRIVASEDPSMVGQVFNITKPRTTIGRGADNDLVLPRDKAVSRHHAMIESTGTGLFLTEVVSQDAGAIKRPTYGTFVNGQQVGPMPVELNTGDEIRLGTQLILQFEKFQSSLSSDPDKTLDGFNVPPQAPHKPTGDETLIM